MVAVIAWVLLVAAMFIIAVQGFEIADLGKKLRHLNASVVARPSLRPFPQFEKMNQEIAQLRRQNEWLSRDCEFFEGRYTAASEDVRRLNKLLARTAGAEDDTFEYVKGEGGK